MSSHGLAEAFIEKCITERRRLADELQSYEPLGVMRLWQGRSVDHLHEVTNERVDALRRELAMIDAMIEFASAIGRAL
jgi:hypothetical protein